SRTFTVPELSADRRWLKIIDTAAPPPHDILAEEEGEMLVGRKVAVGGMGAVVLISKPRP
ncbi:MAG: hypothetical protein OEV91_11115, partial [Desulfobulbaceae bacterium]|nr:hypothetical protein [Desulfobulbaceae bacterium]